MGEQSTFTEAAAREVLGDKHYAVALTKGAAWAATESVIARQMGEDDRAESYRFVEWAINRRASGLPLQ